MTFTNTCDVRRAFLVLVLAAASTRQPLRAQDSVSSNRILNDMRSFRVVGTVLHVGAHPDDENTHLIAYLAHGRAFRAGYLSVTRGDGGQNLLGAQLGEKLGVARTQELLAARRIDGGHQFFTRAIDYGFSKDYREALQVWGHQQALSDVVRVVRTFRPDVIITRFSTEPGGTHGHHTASAVLALEAFRYAADPSAFPEQIAEGLPTWQATRILVNGGTGARAGLAPPAGSLSIDVGGIDPVTGESFAAVADRSRGMHKTQGFGQNDPPQNNQRADVQGPPRTAPREEWFQLLAGDSAHTDIMDGIDTTWNRISGGAPIATLINGVIERFDARNPDASVDDLLRIRSLLGSLAGNALAAEKRALLDHIIVECLGLAVRTTVPDAEVTPGQTITLSHSATMRSRRIVRWTGIRFPGTTVATTEAVRLQLGTAVRRTSVITLPVNMQLTQPYWLREDPAVGMYRVANPRLIGMPENPAALPVLHTFEIAGHTIEVRDEPVQLLRRGGTPTSRRIAVVAPVSMRFLPETEVFAPGVPRRITLQFKSERPNVSGTASVSAPPEWSVTPASSAFRLARGGDSMVVTFTVTPPAAPTQGFLAATARIGSASYSTQRIDVDYPHIPLQVLQPPARQKAVAMDVAIRGRSIAYIPGAGDFIPDALRQMGYTVTVLDSAIASADLAKFDAIVLGIRAANVRTDLDSALPALFAYAANGGTVVWQYNTASGLRTNQLAPFNLTLSQSRVTDENARMSILAPDHPVLNTPNRITAVDFEGWVQERGLYYPSGWDPRFVPIVAANDIGEAPLQGGLLVAQHGKGWIVYTGLSFFRQLPAGVPGAYRLFANIVSLGK